MRIELKDFQTDAARSIVEDLGRARSESQRGKLQAVVLSAPTGSGKTITVAAVIDWLLGGAEGIPARPETTFLWLSDSPELNVQSRGKLLAACENLPFHRMIPVDSESFDEETLQPGNVYFINTQLLGKDKLLTKGGDKKGFTFWQTVSNTIAAMPEDFILIIDEAHRGTGVSEKVRKPIMQKFITGSDVDGLPPVPIVLGMSATPQRFTDLLGNTTRTQRPAIITPEMVRASGLLKDMIVVSNPKSAKQSDLTLLENAAGRWREFWKSWEQYCTKEQEKQLVRPILVVQVEDGTEKVLTRTPLDEVVKVIERQTGPLEVNEIVHCFQDQQDLQSGGRIIRRIDPSRVQDSSEVKVVLFKTALSTGWDCPRAEVMMSFRRAKDPTSIAQLVGRMIRTPLARRIETDEVLNTVDLFLPHYDSEALDGVLARLRNPEEHEGLPTEITTKAVIYQRDVRFKNAFAHLATLPTYTVSRVPKMSNLKRALRLAGLLVYEGIDREADEALRGVLIAALKQLRDKYAADADTWGKIVREGGQIEVDVTKVAIGDMDVSGRQVINMVLSQENIDHLFDGTGRLLAAGEGLHRTYWKQYQDQEKPNAAKLELFAVVNHEETSGVMERFGLAEFERLWKLHKDQIRTLPEGTRQRFEHLQQAAGKASSRDWTLPEKIIERPGKSKWDHHLFVDGDGHFAADFNTWESEFLSAAMKDRDFHCWLRNIPRRDWALCVPYEHAGERPFFPDFIIVRKQGKGYVVDILEPHDDSRMDTWAKAKGLAQFAERHHMDFGRMQIGRKVDGKLQVVDVADPKVRAKALKMSSPNDLEALFEAV